MACNVVASLKVYDGGANKLYIGDINVQSIKFGAELSSRLNNPL
jgi:hypothetical protein